MGDATIFGYFDSPSATKPKTDPGLDVPCPICLRAVSELPRITTSLMVDGDLRSYFFRAHRSCWIDAPDHEKDRIEHALVDAILAAKAN